jgi:hypothetical protein
MAADLLMLCTLITCDPSNWLLCRAHNSTHATAAQTQEPTESAAEHSAKVHLWHQWLGEDARLLTIGSPTIRTPTGRSRF